MSDQEQPKRVRRSFSHEFKRDAVALVLDEGRTIADVARTVGVGESNLGNWVRQARADAGEGPGSRPANAPSWPSCAERTGSSSWSVSS